MLYGEKKRKDTQHEAEAPGFVALGRLLLEKSIAFMAYTKFLCYDLIASSAANNTSARLRGMKG